MAYCETDDLLDALFPKFQFRESLTPTMLKKMQELPPDIRKRVMDKGWYMNSNDITDLALGTNPQRLEAMKNRRGFEKVKNIAEDPYAQHFLENMAGGRRKNQTLNAEQLHAATVGAMERYTGLAKNGRTILEAMESGDEEMYNFYAKTINEALALEHQIAGAKSEVGRALGYIRKLNEMKANSPNLISLFGGIEC